MGTIKQDRKDLEALLNGVAPIATSFTGAAPIASPTVPTPQPQPQPTNINAVVDNTAGTTLEPERLFEFDYDALRKSLRKKARKTIQNLTKHILTDQMLESDYVKDKIEQDIESLRDLYMQVESNNVMQRSILDTVSRGNTMPRMYEVFGQLTDKIQAINKQILATEAQIRKTYIDLKFEIKDKETELIEMAQNYPNALTTSQPQGNQNIVTSSKQLIEMAKKKHMEKLNSIKEIECTEEND
jgi:predicted DNA-binding protein